MANKHFNLFLYLILVCTSLGASSDSTPSKPLFDEANVGHIFKKGRGHFDRDTPENRAFIEAAANSGNKVGVKTTGVEVYLRTMPDGSQSWAEVWKGKITNGGRNPFPKIWVSDPNHKGGFTGGYFKTPKFSCYKADSQTFKGHLVVNNIKSAYEVACQTPQYTALQIRKIQGVAARYGKILNLLEKPTGEGEHTFYIPTYELSETEALQVLRDVARGIYVYGDLPFFSLHFNRSMTSYPVIPPVYRHTLTGEALAMLDYYMKGFVNGRFFEKDAIEGWNETKEKSQDYLLEHTCGYHEYCENLGIRYRTFNEILEDVMEGEPPKGTYKDCFNISYQIVFKQNMIYKSGDSLSYEGGFDVTGKVEGTPSTDVEARHYDYLVEACALMCDQIEETLPKLPICKKYFQVLYLANFFSYYCNSLKEVSKIPMLDRMLAENETASCPQAFPPLPVSLQKELKLPFIPLLESMPKNRLTQVNTYLNANPASEQMIHEAYDAIHEGVFSYVKEYSLSQKLTVDQYGDLTFEVLQYFKKRYQAFEKNIAALFKGTEFEGAMTNGSTRQKFFQHVDHRIATSHGNQRQEMIKIKDAATKWFTNPLVVCFEDSGFLFSLLDGSVKFIRECSSGQIHVAGGCGVAVEDMEAQGSTWLGYFHRGISIKAAYGDMEIDEGEDPEAVAKGYLYPPLSNHPFDNHVMNVLQAIADEDVVLFEKSCAGIKDWNFKDPSRVSLVHHASRCKNPLILQKLIQKGADLKVMDLQGFYPTHYAAASNSVECLKVLLKHAPELLEVQAEEGQTPLFAAVQYGAYKSVHALLSMGARPHCVIVNDLSPLLWAIQSKNTQIAMRLLAHEDIHLEHALRDGSCALDYAIEMKQTLVLKRLIECGANVNHKCRGYTPLHLGVANGYLGGVKALLECRDTILTAKTLEGGETPMEMAQRLGHQEIVNFLVKQAASRR